MAQWGRNDQAVTANSSTTKESSNGAPIGTYALVKGSGQNATPVAMTPNGHFGNTSTGSRASVDSAMFGNTTIGAFIPNMAVGVYGVDTTEMGLSSGVLGLGRVTSGGSGYSANASVTLTVTNGGTSGVVNAQATTGKITALNISTAGSGYVTDPIVTIAAPSAITIVANTSGFSNTTDTLVVTTANSIWAVGDRLYYGVPAGNTAIAPLAGNTYYYVSFANSSTIALSTTLGGSNVDITDTRAAVAGQSHTITGDTATGVVLASGAKNNGVAHAGWNIRKEGTGGRAGRVQYECLVAMGSLGAQTAAYGTPAAVADASDDNILHDS